MASTHSSDASMAQDLSATHASPEEAAYRQDRIELAAAYRILHQEGLSEGISNHLTMISKRPIPGSRPVRTEEVLLVFAPHLAWAEVTASNLLALDGQDRVVDGAADAFQLEDMNWAAIGINRAFHRARPVGARAVFHSHMPYATALACHAVPELLPCHLNCCRFVDDLAYDLDCGSGEDDFAEGERLARAIGDSPALLMQAHGVITVGATAALAFDRMYYLERACRVQMLAMSAGQDVVLLPKEMKEKLRRTAVEREVTAAKMHFQSVIRRLRVKEPEFEI